MPEPRQRPRAPLLHDPVLARGQQRVSVAVAGDARHRLAEQGDDDGGLAEVRAQQVDQFPVLVGEVPAVAVQRDADQAAVGGGSADHQLVVDPGRAVEVAVKAERAELPVAGDIGDAPGCQVARRLVVPQKRMLGQVLLEQLGGIREVKHLRRLDLPGHAGRADEVAGARLRGHQSGYDADHPAGKSPPSGWYNSASPLLSLRSSLLSSVMTCTCHRTRVGKIAYITLKPVFRTNQATTLSTTWPRSSRRGVTVASVACDGVWHGLGSPCDLFVNLPAAVAYMSGPDLVIEFANDAYLRLAGNREVIGLPIRQALPELTLQGCLDVLERIMRTGQPARCSETEVWLNRGKRAEQLFVDFAGQPMRNSDGGISGVLLFAADVTSHVQDRRRLDVLAAQLTEAQEWTWTLFETMPQGIIRYRADGSVFSANPAASRILGLRAGAMGTWPLGTGGQAVHEDGTPYRPGELPAQKALRTGEVVHDAVVGKPHAHTGELRWLKVTAVPDERDEQGRPQRAYAIFTDLTEQYQMEAQLRESTSLLGRLRDANVLGVVLVGEERVYEANDAFLKIVGYTRDDVDAGRLSYQSLTASEWADRDRKALAQLHRNGAFPPYEKEYVHRDGHRVPVLVGAAVVNRHPLRWVTFVVDLTARQRAEQERAELHNRERAARAQADYARERLTFLLRAGSMVAATRGREMLDHAAQLVVPALADHCVVMLPTAGGALQATAVAHRDPARAPVLAEFSRYKIPPVGPMTLQAAYTTGSSQLFHDVDAKLPQWHDLPPGLVDVLARLRSNSVLATPLLMDQRPAGVLVLARDAGQPAFAATDIEVVEEFARRLSNGMAAAETYAREHTIAETLQRSLLPEALPAIPGLDLAVRYLPATDGAAVGGDWYDAFLIDVSRVCLVIGDVIGHSISSASIMGQVRTMLRTCALDNPCPGDLLRRTNLALARLLPEAMATVACVVLDLATGELTYASAGHLPPLAMTAGRAEYLDGVAGIMLGAGTDTAYPVGRRRLLPGTGLLLYTDGLIEDRRRDIGVGLDTLASTLRQSAARTAEQICTVVQQAMLGAAPRADDVCLLAIRTREGTRPATHPDPGVQPREL